MHSRLTKIFEKRQIPYYKQFSFRRAFSTNQLESVQKALDYGQAFDTVSIVILVEKQDHNGITDISNYCFRSYLSDRSQFVCISDFNSDYKTMKYGVLQALVLGPLLCLISSMTITLIKHSEIFHFADDTCF